MSQNAARLVRDAQRHLGRPPEVAGERTAEKRNGMDLGARGFELARKLPGNAAACAVPRDDVRPVEAQALHLGGKVGSELFDALERRFGAVEAGQLQPVERTLGAKALREGAEAEYVAVVPGRGEDRDCAPRRLQRHDGARLRRGRLGAGEELQNLVLVPAQLLAQLYGERARGRAAAQLAAPAALTTRFPRARRRRVPFGARATQARRSIRRARRWSGARKGSSTRGRPRTARGSAPAPSSP